jgi:membrane fusion protein (multidrug efflux system)
MQYTTIVAPVDGVIAKKQNVQLGQIVQPGQPLMAIVPLEDIWVTANFKETQLNGMHPGQAATIHVDAYDHDYKGHVDSIGAATGARFSLLPPENATGNYVKVVQRIPVKIVFEKGQDPNHVLRPGMSVVATVFVQ